MKILEILGPEVGRGEVVREGALWVGEGEGVGAHVRRSRNESPRERVGGRAEEVLHTTVDSITVRIVVGQATVARR